MCGIHNIRQFLYGLQPYLSDLKLSAAATTWSQAVPHDPSKHVYSISQTVLYYELPHHGSMLAYATISVLRFPFAIRNLGETGCRRVMSGVIICDAAGCVCTSHLTCK